MKPNRTGRGGKIARHVRLYHWMTDSPAWRDLDALERAIYCEMAKRYGGGGSTHLFEALSIIKEIKDDKDLMTAVERADRKTQESFASVAKFIESKDYGMMAKLRNVVAFHYESKLAVRRLKKIVDKSPGHSTTYSLGNATLDWYFELGDLIADEIVIRDVFQITDCADLEQAATEVLDRLRVIALAFLDFAGYFIRACCAR